MDAGTCPHDVDAATLSPWVRGRRGKGRLRPGWAARRVSGVPEGVEGIGPGGEQKQIRRACRKALPNVGPPAARKRCSADLGIEKERPWLCRPLLRSWLCDR